jgi:hypothetical protein
MEVKITIPSKLSEITLRQYKAFLKVQETETNDKILNAQIIRIFCNAPMETVMLLKLQDVNDITKTIYNLLEQKPALVSKFKLNGNQYGFIPQLDEMSFGEYIDLDTFIGDWDKMEKAMNVLYRPILVSLKDKYSIEDYNIDTSEDLIDMPMDAVLGAIFFFWNLGIDLSTVMMNSLEGEQAQALMEQQTLEGSGVGIKASMDYLKEILDDLKILPA